MKKVFLILVTILFVACSKDNDGDASTEITITISDFSITIDENPVDGQVIGTINASTNQGSLSFSITEESPAGAFSINSSTGELKVADASLFDYEVNPTISATVRAVNGNVNRTASIEITLQDLYENVYGANAILLTQEDINDFGKMNYTEISGYLQIGNEINNSIHDLSPLSSLNKVIYGIYIEGNTNLLNLSGLENITQIGRESNFIGGYLLIKRNENLNDLTALSNTQIFEVSLIVDSNNSLTNLTGLENLVELHDLRIYANPNLGTLEGLENVATVNSVISIVGNNNLSTLSSLSNLTQIGNSIRIEYNDSLVNLNGLENVSSPIEELTIGGLSLTSLSGLNQLTSVEYFTLIGTESLTSLNDLENITNIGELNLLQNESLVDISILKNIKGNLYSLQINENNSLNNLSGLQNINSISKNLRFFENNSLESLEGLNNIKNVGGYILFKGNESLSDYCSLQTLYKNSGFEGGYFIKDNLFNPKIYDFKIGNCSL